MVWNIEIVTGKKPIEQYTPNQPGDVEKTWAGRNGLGYYPVTGIQVGIEEFFKLKTRNPL